MVSWSDIRAEYDALELTFRERVVALFRQYEGQETDEKVRGKVVKVTQNSFAKRMGIEQRTFNDWVRSAKRDPLSEIPEPTACVNDGLPTMNGAFREANEKLRSLIPHLRHLSENTHEMIAMDILDLEQTIAEIKENLKVRIP